MVLKKGPLNKKQFSTFKVEKLDLAEEACWISDYLNHTTESSSDKTIKDQLNEVFTDIFGNQKDLSGNIYELGGDSLTAAEIAGRLNKNFSILKLTVADILRNNSIDSLSNFLSNNNFSESTKEIVKSKVKNR